MDKLVGMGQICMHVRDDRIYTRELPEIDGLSETFWAEELIEAMSKPADWIREPFTKTDSVLQRPPIEDADRDYRKPKTLESLENRDKERFLPLLGLTVLFRHLQNLVARGATDPFRSCR